MPLVLATLADAGLEFIALDRIAATTGPGSFTGIRIGLAAARGMGLAAAKPVIGIDRFSIYQTVAAAQPLLIVLESRRAELFVQYNRDTPHMWTREQIADFLTNNPTVKLAGDSALQFFPGTEIMPLPQSEVIVCATLAAQADAANPAFLPRPFYLRAPDVTMARQA